MVNFMQNAKENNQLTDILSGIIKSFIITFVLIMLLSILLVNTSISENTISPGIFTITCISIFGGTVTSIRKQGIIAGSVVGISYIAIIYLLSSMLGGEFGLTLSSLILILLSIVFGIVGGVVGVNIKK